MRPSEDRFRPVPFYFPPADFFESVGVKVIDAPGPERAQAEWWAISAFDRLRMGSWPMAAHRKAFRIFATTVAKNSANDAAAAVFSQWGSSGLFQWAFGNWPELREVVGEDRANALVK